MTGVLVLLSGGLDSTVLATCLKQVQDDHVETLSISYGQRHSRELHSATLVADQLDLEHDIIDLSVLAPHLSRSALTNAALAVPDGHYTQASMAATVVHNRNAIMLSVAAGVAASRRLAYVATAVHAGDHAVYPDCRPEFIEALSYATQIGTAGFGNVALIAPFVDQTKQHIVETGDELGAPMHLTWSCYKGGDVHCGRCGTCVERAEAFHLAGKDDPTVYEDADYWRTVTKDTQLL